MSKKKHPEHVNHERWLVSYADFITLLFAFFVVLFASSQSDKKKQVQMANAMQTAFDHNGIFEQHTNRPPLAAGTTSIQATPAAIPLPLPPSVFQQHLEQVLAGQVAAHRIPPGSVTLHDTPDGLVISLHEAGFFASGSAEVQPTSLATIDLLAKTLPQSPLRIEGHTDNVPIHTAQFATNWELSTARAATITRLLLNDGHMQPANLSAAGYAEFHPIASNLTDAGRAQNRRVDIIVLHGATMATPPRPPSTHVPAP
ncbi:MAG: OmpA family protein [Acidobacteriota bacterium]|nr:OmpA family protein [Acidobacteriota bacterium]